MAGEMAELIGYTDKLSVAPGDQIAFKVSTDHAGFDANIVRLVHADVNGPGVRMEQVSTTARHPGQLQETAAGSYARIDDPVLADLRSLTIQLWVYPTTPAKGKPQGLITRWTGDSGWALVIGETGELGFWMGAEGAVERCYTSSQLRSHQWYFVALTLDAEVGLLTLYQRPLTPNALETALAPSRHTVNSEPFAPEGIPLLMAATHAEVFGASRLRTFGHFNGKLDNPRVFKVALTAEEVESLFRDTPPQAVAPQALVASWDFSHEITGSTLVDVGPHVAHGMVVNMPMRAVTGHAWDSTEFDYKRAPSHYTAIHFHDDDLEDAGWETSFRWLVPQGTRSGFYAAHVRDADVEDHIPFFVRPKRGSAAARAVVLVSTMTYLAYANDRMKSFPIHQAGITNRPIVTDPLDELLEAHPEFAMSIYDVHSDGSGCCYSSRLRPIPNMRPHYRMWLVGAPRHLGADLYLIDWLEAKGIAYDVITDEDLHAEGTSLLKGYSVVLTGTHPEYWTSPMLKSLETYLNTGGRMMYLGGNGFYWVTAVDPERPHVIEVRRGTSSTRAWNSEPGEQYHSATGEMGGLWRHRGFAPNRVAGVGFTGMGWDSPTPGYRRQPGSFDPRAEFIFEGIGSDETIGDFGLVLGGAAGDEIDRLDYALGSPPHTLLLASATDYSRHYLPVIEDVLEISASLIAEQDPNVRADMVYFEMPDGGAVFSTGSITWCGSLSHNQYENNVSRITENVLRRFVS